MYAQLAAKYSDTKKAYGIQNVIVVDLKAKFAAFTGSATNEKAQW